MVPSTIVDLGAVARIYPEYGSGEGLEIAAEAISLYMQECAEAATTWLEVVDEFEGVEQVPLMTVHKSKGLEYDTILRGSRRQDVVEPQGRRL